MSAAGRRALHLPFSRVEIVTADLGQDAVALGGATLPIARLLTAGAVAPRHPEKPRRIRSVAPPAETRASASADPASGPADSGRPPARARPR